MIENLTPKQCLPLNFYIHSILSHRPNFKMNVCRKPNCSAFP